MMTNSEKLLEWKFIKEESYFYFEIFYTTSDG